jgi:nicotinate-nucleotide adenylyltransferase
MSSPQTTHKRVGIFAGSFDPIHDGHLAVVESAIKNIGLDRVLIMVEKNPWSSKKPISIEHRKNMVNLAIENIDNVKQLELEDDRFDLEKTLPQIEYLYQGSELHFIFGADVFLQINKTNWPGLKKLLEHKIVVFERSNISEEEITGHSIKLGIAVSIFPSQHPHHSSTDVRRKPHNKHIWLPSNIAKYIDENELYSVSDSNSE